MVHDGTDWNLRKRNEIIEQLKEDGYEYIDAKYTELKERGLLDEATIRKLDRFLEKRDNVPQRTILTDDIELILYNKRGIPIDTSRKIKDAQLTETEVLSLGS